MHEASYILQNCFLSDLIRSLTSIFTAILLSTHQIISRQILTRIVFLLKIMFALLQEILSSCSESLLQRLVFLRNVLVIAIAKRAYTAHHLQKISNNGGTEIDFIMNFVAQSDKNLSEQLHKADRTVLTLLLYPFTAFFHPKLIWLAFLCIAYFSEWRLYMVCWYILGTLMCLTTTYVLKKMLKRARPSLISTVKKPHHFRLKEKNNSMPSGDAIQSALFVTFLWSLNVPSLPLAFFHLSVCIGRVYYMCHWLGDTFTATILGVAIGKIIYFLATYPQLLLFFPFGDL